MTYGDPIRIKIMVNGDASKLQNEYNEFAKTHTIKASQYKMNEKGFSICAWYEWSESEAAYEETKDDSKLMGHKNEL